MDQTVINPLSSMVAKFSTSRPICHETPRRARTAPIPESAGFTVNSALHKEKARINRAFEFYHPQSLSSDNDRA
jgi:hypothetical protein